MPYSHETHREAFLLNMALDRRSFLSVSGRAGLASTLFPGALYTIASQAAEAQQSPSTPAKPFQVTTGMIEQAALLAGVTISPEHMKMMMDGLDEQRRGYAEIRALHMPNSVAPAFVFHPLAPGAVVDREKQAPRYSQPPTVTASPAVGSAPAELESLAFAPVMELADLVRRKKVSSVNLTEMYLTRLKRYDPVLHFVVTLTEERAMSHAREADAAIAAGRYKGPLHGLPWGAKDLLAVKGYPTTWGAGGFEHQSFEEDAVVVQRLDAAGAVLVAKTTLGALAMGDKWFAGRTRNPWNTKQGSSGSSAGSASSVSAGCVAFAIGSETLGSISSPSTRCGVTGLRPTFGFVPRTGAMALSWTMDKLGPICRAVEDCAAVLSAIYGPDGHDLAASDAAFNWNAELDWRSLRVGYLASEFEEPKPTPKPDSADRSATTTPAAPLPADQAKQRKEAEASRAEGFARRVYDHRYDAAALDALRKMGVQLSPVELPKLPYDAMVPLLSAEAAAAFDELTMTGRDALLTEQGPEDWPNSFRVARLYPAVEYIQANRARTLAIAQVSKLFAQYDVIVGSSGGEQLVVTNLTGHPAVIVPNGLRGADAPLPPKIDKGDDDSIGGPGTPVSLTFLGGHYQDAKVCALARAYQQATGFEKLHPKL
jgi:Asp-tRNA(Asn)/Glu-tRNA(Gln) amidotransferase A subunit family amidase